MDTREAKMRTLRALWHDQEGGIQAETAVLIAFVALAGIGLWQHFGDITANAADRAASAFEDGTSPAGRPLVNPASSDYTQPR